jgi:hypothetical protein
MARDAFTLATIHFQAKADSTLYTELHMRTEAASVDWYEAIQIIDQRLNMAVHKAAHAALCEMARDWTPEQWQAARQRCP